AVGEPYVLDDRAGRDRPPVDRHEQSSGRGGRHPGPAEGPEETAPGYLRGQLERRREEPRTEDPGRGVLQVVRGRIRTGLATLGLHAKAHLGPREIEPLDRLKDRHLLRGRALEELPAGGCVEEELLDLHGRSRGARGGESTAEGAPDDRDPLRDLTVGRPG